MASNESVKLLLEPSGGNRVHDLLFKRLRRFTTFLLHDGVKITESLKDLPSSLSSHPRMHSPTGIEVQCEIVPFLFSSLQKLADFNEDVNDLTFRGYWLTKLMAKF